MLDHLLTEEQREIKAWAHEFAEKMMRPVAAEYDEREEVAWPAVNEAAKAGFLSYPYPEKYGGGGITSVMLKSLIGEELAWGCAGIADTIGGTHLAGTPLMQLANEEQLARILPIICQTDKPHLAAFCLTEPEAGSDVASMRTTATRAGDEYILNGRKCFITNSGIADLFLVFATVDRSQRHRGITAFIVEKGTPGLETGKKEKKLGTRSSYTGDVVFDNLRVPVENRLSTEGNGFMGAMRTLEEARIGVAASAVGLAQAAYEAALAYAKERKTFGLAIARHQAVAFMLADMATEIEAARSLVYQASALADCGKQVSLNRLASMAKLFASDMVMKVTTDAVQIFGGYGYIRDYPVEKYMRDAKIKQIYEGTNQIQRQVIANEIIGRA